MSCSSDRTRAPSLVLPHNIREITHNPKTVNTSTTDTHVVTGAASAVAAALAAAAGPAAGAGNPP